MPLTPTSAKGLCGIMIEGTSGEVSLLPATNIIATITGFTAPSGSTGMRLHIIITNWTTSGTFTITGTGTPGNSEGAINVPAPTAQQLQSPQIANFEYVSVNSYTAITNITTTGLTSGVMVVKGVQGAKFNIPVTAFKSNHKIALYSPNEFSGFMARDKKLIQAHNEASLDAFDSDWYGDLSLYWPYMLLGNPVGGTWTTLPAAPVSVVASATIVASLTIANQPTAPGMKLIIVASTFASGASLTIVGTSYGIATTEVVTITGNGTFYSANTYSAITSIGGTTNATTVVITGVFGWKGTFNSEGTRQTAAVEHYDGSGSWTHPFSFATDGDFEVSTKGEAKLTIKGGAQDKLPIGDRTTNPLQVSRVASIGAPLADLPAAGWQTQIYIDAITGTAGTTVFTDPDETFKLMLKTPVEPHWTFNNQQEFTRAYAIKPECTVDVTYDILNLLQFEQMRQNLKQYLNVALIGEYMGTTGGAAVYKGWTWTLPVRYEDYAQEGDPGKGNTFAKPKLRCEYDAGIGGAYQLVVVTRQPPTYTV